MRSGLNYEYRVFRNNLESEEYMRALEKKLIKIHVKMGYEVLNIADTELETVKVQDDLRYETQAIQKSAFKRYCERNNLVFEDYIQYWSGERDGYVKTYFYVHKARVNYINSKGVEEVDRRIGNTIRRNAVMSEQSKAKMSDTKFYPIEYYETHPTTIRLFKKTLEKRGMKLEDFTWEDTDIRTKKGEVKKIFKRINNKVVK